ncbi:enoyl-CoA hydratase/isomerase family protein [Streptomyces sp. NPDC020965]|uniref:enoyl-CoA hydratase/isomerase family protein n=1 Tax=Streptomyces sp. NPDC020965 TaxID=3365105 RepID=UPI00378BFDC3
MKERSAELVERVVDGAVVILTLNDPAKGNALSPSMLHALNSAIGDISRTPTVRAVVIAGRGRAFCLGADVAELEQILDGTPAADWESRLDALAALVLGVRRLRCPVIAVLDGQVAGAGLALALACDYRIASNRVAMNLAYGRIGASTDGGASWYLPRIVGHHRALDILLEQSVIRAQRALELGLVTAVVDRDGLMDAALARARELTGLSPHAVGAAKRALDASFSNSLAEHLKEEHEEFLAGLQTMDMRRGLVARSRGEWAEFEGN